MVSEVFDPSSVFRIDHYLGKETVQNILALRFANAMYEPIWNNNYVDHVQITHARTSAWPVVPDTMTHRCRTRHHPEPPAAAHGIDRHGGTGLLLRR